MSNGNSAEAETMQGAFQLGYSRKQVINSILLAVLLHGAIVGGYLVIGSEKKPPAGKTAAKDEKKDGATPPGKETGSKSDTPKGDGKSDAASTTPDEGAKKAPDKAKGAEASKASELPTAPDSDIDSILKAK